MNTNHHPGHHLTTLLYHHEASRRAKGSICTPVRGTGYWVRGTGFGASRCAKGSICTPERGTGFGVSGLAVCKGPIHTPLRG